MSNSLASGSLGRIDHVHNRWRERGGPLRMSYEQSLRRKRAAKPRRPNWVMAVAPSYHDNAGLLLSPPPAPDHVLSHGELMPQWTSAGQRRRWRLPTCTGWRPLRRMISGLSLNAWKIKMSDAGPHAVRQTKNNHWQVSLIGSTRWHTCNSELDARTIARGLHLAAAVKRGEKSGEETAGQLEEVALVVVRNLGHNWAERVIMAATLQARGAPLTDFLRSPTSSAIDPLL